MQYFIILIVTDECLLRNSAKYFTCISVFYLTTTLCSKILIIFFLEMRKLRLREVKEGSVQFSSVAQSCPTLCDPMNCSTPGLPVHHQLPEFTQTHAHRVGDATQPSHPLSSPSPPASSPSQNQGLFQRVNSVSNSSSVVTAVIQNQIYLASGPLLLVTQKSIWASWINDKWVNQIQILATWWTNLMQNKWKNCLRYTF